MGANELLSSGDLTGAIAACTAAVKAAPGNLEHRSLLFDLLGFAGDWGRALKQLDAIGHVDQSTGAIMGAQVYRNLIESEQKRAEVFERGIRPNFVLEPPGDVKLRLEAMELLRQGRASEAAARIDEAENLRSPISGTRAESTFDDIRDGDDLLAPVLEVFATGGYFWVPWAHVQLLEVGRPRQLRDLIWLPAKLATHDGQMGEVFLPNLYPGTNRSSDDATRLGRKTEWPEAAPGVIRGLGLKMFLVGEESCTLADMGELRIEASSEDRG